MVWRAPMARPAPTAWPAAMARLAPTEPPGPTAWPAPTARPAPMGSPAAAAWAARRVGAGPVAARAVRWAATVASMAGLAAEVGWVERPEAWAAEGDSARPTIAPTGAAPTINASTTSRPSNAEPWARRARHARRAHCARPTDSARSIQRRGGRSWRTPYRRRWLRRAEGLGTRRRAMK